MKRLMCAGGWVLLFAFTGMVWALARDPEAFQEADPYGDGW